MGVVGFDALAVGNDSDTAWLSLFAKSTCMREPIVTHITPLYHCRIESNLTAVISRKGVTVSERFSVPMARGDLSAAASVINQRQFFFALQ